MNKTKVLALILCTAVMLMGAGYAYWTDTLVINNTVTTGEFDVAFNSAYTRGYDGAYPAYVYHDGQSGRLRQYVVPTEVSSDKQSITATIGNMYPGAQGSIEARIDNTGTIPAVIESIDVQCTGNQELIDTLRFAAGFDIYNETTNAPIDGNSSMQWTWGSDLDGVANTNIDSQKGLEFRLNQMLQGVRLEPEQYLKFDMPNNEVKRQAMELIGAQYNEYDECIWFTFPGEADSDSSLEKQESNIIITVNWKQHNAQ